jgi:hypothetical protein
MLLIISDTVKLHELMYMANITLKVSDKYFQIKKHRYAIDVDHDRYYPIHSLQNYVTEWTYGNIYGTPESYGKQVIVTVLTEQDLEHFNPDSAIFTVADIVLIKHTVNHEPYYKVMKNTYNNLMKNRSYDVGYIDELINAYQRRGY